MTAITEFKDENRFLSNFTKSPVTIKINGRDFTFPTGEHAYQASKALVADELSWEERFAWINEMVFVETPGRAKRAGLKIKANMKAWNGGISTAVMKSITNAKYTQNPELKDKLLATGDVELIEGNNWGDKIWGTVDGEGENRLGKILMDTRERLRSQQ